MNTAQPPAITVVHSFAAQQFEVQLNGALAVCVYRLEDGLLDIEHTEVPEALAGRGLAGTLVAAALAWARAQGLRVRATCSYARSYLHKHPETRDLLAP
jgi:predicted GNAT family acetyltransferase